MNLVTEQNLLGWTMNLHRESVSGRWGFSLGFRSTLPWSVGWFCTVDLNLYGYIWGTVIAQRFSERTQFTRFREELDPDGLGRKTIKNHR